MCCKSKVAYYVVVDIDVLSEYKNSNAFLEEKQFDRRILLLGNYNSGKTTFFKNLNYVFLQYDVDKEYNTFKSQIVPTIITTLHDIVKYFQLSKNVYKINCDA